MAVSAPATSRIAPSHATSHAQTRKSQHTDEENGREPEQGRGEREVGERGGGKGGGGQGFPRCCLLCVGCIRGVKAGVCACRPHACQKTGTNENMTHSACPQPAEGRPWGFRYSPVTRARGRAKTRSTRRGQPRRAMGLSLGGPGPGPSAGPRLAKTNRAHAKNRRPIAGKRTQALGRWEHRWRPWAWRSGARRAAC